MRAWLLPACRGGVARGSTGRGPGGRGGSSFLTVPALAAGYEKPGANTVTWGLPVTVGLVTAACASSDDDAVTWEDVMDRMAWRRTAVKDSSSVVTGALSLRRRARAAAA